MAREEIFSIENAVTSAEQAAGRGAWADAEWHYRRLVAHSHVIDYEYEEWVRRLAEIYGLAMDDIAEHADRVGRLLSENRDVAEFVELVRRAAWLEG